MSSPKSPKSLESGSAWVNDSEEEGETEPLIKQDSRPRFKVLMPIGLKEAPKIGAGTTGEILKVGEVFAAQDIVTVCDDEETHWTHIPLDQHCYLNLSDGRGWAINKNLITDAQMLEPYHPDPTIRQFLSRFFQSMPYEYAIMAVILANAAVIGLQIDHEGILSAHSWHALNWVIALIYILEVSLKMFAFGPVIFFESRWNCFDFFVTSVTVIGDILPLFFNDSVVISAVAPVLRLLRLLRLAKLFRELKTLIDSFASSLTQLFWIFVFFVLWYYIVAIVCTVFVGTKKWMPDGSMGDYDAATLRKKFQTIPLSMYTLFEVMTLEGWIDVVNPLARHRPALVFFFMVFLFVSAFFLLNLVTAVIVNSTVEAQQKDEAIRASRDDDKEIRTVNHITNFIQRRNGGEDIALRSDVKSWLKDRTLKRELAKLHWTPDMVLSAMSVLDKKATGEISIEKLEGLIACTTRPLDMITVVKMQAEMTERLEGLLSGSIRLVEGSRLSEP